MDSSLVITTRPNGVGTSGVCVEAVVSPAVVKVMQDEINYLREQIRILQGQLEAKNG